MQKKLENKPRKNNSVIITSAWSGYNQSYVQNIIKTAMKGLELLSVLTFDIKLLFWVEGLKRHLNNRMKEAEREEKEIERYKF